MLNGRMNKDQAKKLDGHMVRLQPPARGPQNETCDDDWLVRVLSDDTLQLINTSRSGSLMLGVDHIFSYFTDAARSTPALRFGFLQLLSQVQIAKDGQVTAAPLPPPRTAGQAPAPSFDPLIVADGSRTWVSEITSGPQ